MYQTIQTLKTDDLRDWRSMEQTCRLSSERSQERMEATMFEALRKFGGFRVDYMNQPVMGSPKALAFYVLGDLTARQPYSQDAKRSLLAGLCLIREQVGTDCLVAVYLDVNCACDAHRPAYQQMKRDMKAGMFRRVFVMDTRELMTTQGDQTDFWNFYRELHSCEVLSLRDGRIMPVSVQAVEACHTSCHMEPTVL